MYDAVHLFAKALHDLDTSQQIDVRPLSCEAEDTWPHGYSLINYMKIVSTLKKKNSCLHFAFYLKQKSKEISKISFIKSILEFIGTIRSE